MFNFVLLSLMYLIDKQVFYSKLLKGEGKEKLSRSNLDRIFEIDWVWQDIFHGPFIN